MIEIVEAHAAPAVSVAAALMDEYVVWLGVDLSFQGWGAERASLPGAYAPPDGRLLLARADGEAAGCVALRRFDATSCEMKRLWVRPAFRGSGAGRALAERLVAEARGIGYARMLLDTLATMAEANALYLALGFRDVAPYRHNPLHGARFFALELR